MCIQWTADRHLPAAPSKASCHFTAVPQFWFARSAQPLRLGTMHKSHPIISSSIWSAASGNFQYPRTPTFDAHVSLPSNYLVYARCCASAQQTGAFTINCWPNQTSSTRVEHRSSMNSLIFVCALNLSGQTHVGLAAILATEPSTFIHALSWQ